MFGYIKPDTPYLFVKDEILYNALYCGVCKAIGSSCSQLSRFCLTYDVAFLSAFAHNVCNVDVTIKKECCIAHPIISRKMASRDDLTEKLGAMNVILARYKLLDDVYDLGKGRLKSIFFNSGYKKAVKKYPEIERIVKEGYFALAALEKQDEKSVDRVSDPFATLLKNLSDEVLGGYATEHTGRLFYSLGKYIYLIDALDDLEKDIKKNNYNVFYKAYGEKKLKSLLSLYGEEIDFIFSSVFSVIKEELESIKFYFNSDLVKNILIRGLPAAYKKVIESKFKRCNQNKKSVDKSINDEKQLKKEQI